MAKHPRETLRSDGSLNLWYFVPSNGQEFTDEDDGKTYFWTIADRRLSYTDALQTESYGQRPAGRRVHIPAGTDGRGNWNEAFDLTILKWEKIHEL